MCGGNPSLGTVPRLPIIGVYVLVQCALDVSETHCPDVAAMPVHARCMQHALGLCAKSVPSNGQRSDVGTRRLLVLSGVMHTTGIEIQWQANECESRP